MLKNDESNYRRLFARGGQEENAEFSQEVE
jgi:hypothetical protein